MLYQSRIDDTVSKCVVNTSDWEDLSLSVFVPRLMDSAHLQLSAHKSYKTVQQTRKVCDWY